MALVPTTDTTFLQSLGVQGNAAIALINSEVKRQAVLIAYLDDFKLMMIVTFAVLPMLLLMRKSGAGGPKPTAVME